MLISLPADKAVVFEAAFADRDLFSRRIGKVEPGAGVVLS